MGRGLRPYVDSSEGSYHIISRVVNNDFLLEPEDREYFVNLMFNLTKAYYVDISTYVVMSNHFHILLSNSMYSAFKASKEELVKRYKDCFGESAEFPLGSYIKNSYEMEWDEDGGIERLRNRLGSVSRFMQDLKQRFTKWYNKKYKRHGTLWAERFKTIITSKGEGEIICSAYIDLNPLRAGMVKKPEDYRWSSIGLKVRNPKKAELLLKKIVQIKSYYGVKKAKDDYKIIVEVMNLGTYLGILYRAGNKEVEGKAKISDEDLLRAKFIVKGLKIEKRLLFRCRDISEGVAFGTYNFIAKLQEKLGRKFIKPRKIFKDKEDSLCTFRRFKPI